MSEEEEVEVRAERQFIDSVLSDNKVEAETAFKTSMAAKVGDTLDRAFLNISIALSFFSFSEIIAKES